MERNGKGDGVTIRKREKKTYLVRFLCAKFNIGGMNISITDSPHSQ